MCNSAPYPIYELLGSVRYTEHLAVPSTHLALSSASTNTHIPSNTYDSWPVTLMWNSSPYTFDDTSYRHFTKIMIILIRLLLLSLLLVMMIMLLTTTTITTKTMIITIQLTIRNYNEHQSLFIISHSIISAEYTRDSTASGLLISRDYSRRDAPMKTRSESLLTPRPRTKQQINGSHDLTERAGRE